MKKIKPIEKYVNCKICQGRTDEYAWWGLCFLCYNRCLQFRSLVEDDMADEEIKQMYEEIRQEALETKKTDRVIVNCLKLLGIAKQAEYFSRNYNVLYNSMKTDVEEVLRLKFGEEQKDEDRDDLTAYEWEDDLDASQGKGDTPAAVASAPSVGGATGLTDERELYFRQKYPATKRCEDGHYVRSKAEQLIDQYLYTNNIRHCYERIYPVSDDRQFVPDFYLPDLNLYIEYFGCDDERYLEKTEEKIRIYEQDKTTKFAYLYPEDDDFIHDKLELIINKRKRELAKN